MTDRRVNEPLDPELQREDARALDNEAIGSGRDRAMAEDHEVSGSPDVVQQPRTTGEPHRSDAVADRSDRVPRQDAEFGEEVDFDESRAVPGRETEHAAPAPGLATGMFLPVLVLLIVAAVLIFWLVL